MRTLLGSWLAAIVLTLSTQLVAHGADGTTVDVCGTISAYGRATTNILSLNVGGSLRNFVLGGIGNAPADLGRIGTALFPERIRLIGTVAADSMTLTNFTITRVAACGLPNTSTSLPRGWPLSLATLGLCTLLAIIAVGHVKETTD